MPVTDRNNVSSTLDNNSFNNAKKNIDQEFGYRKTWINNINNYTKSLTSNNVKDEFNQRNQALDEEHRKNEDRASRLAKNFASGLTKVTSDLVSSIDKALAGYLNAQQIMAGHLAGSITTVNDISNNLQATLSASNIVKQENVFNNISKLVSSGINYNVEQRAFLQTLANDIDLIFNAQDGSLTQLIRLQNRDLTANRLAIEYSLQKFLNQNYQTSEYIKDAFGSVSESLKTAQSVMSSTQGMDFEATVQSYLGQYYSAGANRETITSLASALNALGSGDISNLGSGISNLVLMGAARAGLDYGSLLNNGLNANTTDQLLSGVMSYLSEMGQRESNVVRSQIGKLFGVSITDLVAANNMRQTTGGVSTNIGEFLSDYAGFVNPGKQAENIISNLKYGLATNIASSGFAGLMGYEISKLVSQSGIGDLLYQFGESINDTALGAIPGSMAQILGVGLNNAPLIPIISSLFGIGTGGGGINDIFSSLSYLTKNTEGTSGIVRLFEAMGNASAKGTYVKTSGANVSSSTYVGSGGDMLSGLSSSIGDIASTTGVTVVESDEPTLEDHVAQIDVTTVMILDLLTERLESIDENVHTLSLTNNIYSAGITAFNDVTNFVV